MFRPNLAIPTRQNIAHLVRILHPPRAWIGAGIGPIVEPSSLFHLRHG
jgi:hypothetical protein